ncbi:MAG: hypothetical protein R3E68_15125 [Burkholderiaceae bacterium]
MLGIEDELKRLNVIVKRAEFVRYADARTALLSNSVDISAVGAGDAIAASQGGKNLISDRRRQFVEEPGRAQGVQIDDWNDIAGKRSASRRVRPYGSSGR